MAEQTGNILKLGIILTAATVTILVAEFFRTRRRPLPAHGWLGLIALVCAEFLMFHGVEPAATYFNPLAWTAYILLADAAAFRIGAGALTVSSDRPQPRERCRVGPLSMQHQALFPPRQPARDGSSDPRPASGDD